MKSYCTINTLFDIKTLFHLYKFFKILNKEKKVAEVYQLRFISGNSQVNFSLKCCHNLEVT